MKTERKNHPFISRLAATAVIALTGATAFAASQTWTNAPVSTSWTNVNNWVAKAVPGAVNGTGNGANADTATFNSPIVGGIGGVANPIAPDDATTAGNRSRAVLGVTFDATNCGAYYFASPSPAVLPGTGIPATGILYVGHNGALRINSPVTNSQTFLIPMYVLLPSSTAGIFNLVNNSTNSNAALYVSQIIHGGATSRATTFILDGTNSAANIVTNLSEGGGNATGGFTKQGNNTWIIAGPGTFPAASPMNINAGTLAVSDPGAFGVASTVTINSNATMRIDNSVTPTTATFTVQRSGAIKLNTGSATVNGITVGTVVAGTSPTLATTASTDVMTVGNAVNKVTGGAADSLIHIAGPGTVALGVGGLDNNYLGKWSVDAGTLSVASAGTLGTGPNVNIAAGGTLDASPLGAVTWNPTTSGFGGTGIGTSVSTAATLKADAAATIDLATGAKAVNLTFTPTVFTGDTTHPSLVVSQGTLALGGNAFNINNASGTALGLGTYRLIQQTTGNVTDGGGYAANITGSGKVAGAVASIVVSGGNVNLVIAAYVPQNLVWTGGALNANWNLATDANWLKGGVVSLFSSSDFVTFNTVGSTNPTVTIVGTMLPSSVTVSNVATYTFGGSGQIAGGASLVKNGSGTLVLNTVNTYTGGTVISNGVIQLGAANAISGTGAGNVQVSSPGILDLNGNNDSINALIGNGTVDTVLGGAPVLTVGNNDNSGTFSGIIQGTASLTKVGVGTETLTSANTYSGTTTVNAGTLVASNLTALGTSAVNVNAGTLDVQTSLNLASLSASGGSTIANSTANAVTITVNGAATTFCNSAIGDGTGGGNIALKILGTTSLTMGGNNTYTGGTIVGSGATFAIPNGGAPNNASVSGSLIASNLATLALSGGSSTPGTPTNITTVDGATVSFTSGALGKIWGSQFQGGATATNRILNVVSFGGDTSFKNFNGIVNLEAAGNVRFINIPAGTAGGGDAATFNFAGSTAVVTRDLATVRLGEIRGGSSASGIDQATTAGLMDTYLIGGKNVNSTFEGFLKNSNNVVKIGSAGLTFDGATITTNTDSATYTNYFYAPLITYFGNTTVSNGTLALVVPNNLSNSPSITLAGSTAVLDVSAMGQIIDQLDISLTSTNQLLVTNGVFELYSATTGGIAQSLGGIGSITGKLLADSGTTVSPGLPTGTLTVSSNIVLNSVNMNVSLNRTNSPNCGQLAASGVRTITVSGGTLTITNNGNDLVTGDVFHIFNKASIGNFAVTNLPASNALNTISYVFTNKLAIDGTLVVLQGASAVNLGPTNVVAVVNGNNLEMSWPVDHTGWVLQVQTNSLANGLGAGWVTIPGTDTNNHYTNTINAVNGAVFYRMFHP